MQFAISCYNITILDGQKSDSEVFLFYGRGLNDKEGVVMRKTGFLTLAVIIFNIITTVCSFAASDLDTISFATYYPSPYGSYHELHADGVSIGSGNRTITPPAEGLIVEGNVGIGIATPSEKLEVSGNIRASGYINASGNINATGDVCTALSGGKCLNTQTESHRADLDWGTIKTYHSECSSSVKMINMFVACASACDSYCLATYPGKVIGGTATQGNDTGATCVCF